MHRMRIVATSILLFFSLLSQAQKPFARLPFQIKNGHLYVQVSVDGSRPLNMAFDTGARANLLHEDVAEELGFTIDGVQQVNDASGTVLIKTSNGHDLKIDVLEMSDETFLLMNLDHLGDEDFPMDGVIGGSILDEYITEINFDASEIRFYERQGFRAPSEFSQQKMSLIPFRVPILSCKVLLDNGTVLEGPYLIDTGAALAIRFNVPLVKGRQLAESIKPNYPYTARALNSQSTDFIGRLPGFEILGHEFQGFPVRMATDAEGVSGRSNVDGIVGTEILKRFNLIFNYREQLLYFQPSLLYDSFFLENFSGLKVRKENGKLWVEEVVENSPASEVGMQVGDQIISVDGRKNFGRTEFLEYVHPLRKDVKLEVIRDEKTTLVNLKPRKII